MSLILVNISNSFTENVLQSQLYTFRQSYFELHSKHIAAHSPHFFTNVHLGKYVQNFGETISINSHYLKLHIAINLLRKSSVNLENILILQNTFEPRQKMALYAKDSRSLATISKLWSVPSKVLQITAARTSPPSPLPWSPVGPNSKNPPKNKIKKSVKLADHTCSCSYLTYFESEAYAIPETEVEVHLLTSGWKNAWNPIRRTYFWRVPAIWTNCAK